MNGINGINCLFSTNIYGSDHARRVSTYVVMYVNAEKK